MSGSWSLAAPPLMSGTRPEPIPEPPAWSFVDTPTIFADPAEARARRHKGLLVQFVGTFSLSGEVRAECAPLAAEVAELLSGPVVPRFRPSVQQEGTELAFWREAVELAAATHRLLIEVCRLLGNPDLGASREGREVAAAVVSDPEHARAPEITDEQLRAGSWPEVLAAYVAPLDEVLAAQLERQRVRDGSVSACSAAVSQLLGREFSPKLGLLRQWIPLVRSDVERREESAGLVADRERRRAAERLQRLGLA